MAIINPLPSADELKKYVHLREDGGLYYNERTADEFKTKGDYQAWITRNKDRKITGRKVWINKTSYATDRVTHLLKTGNEPLGMVFVAEAKEKERPVNGPITLTGEFLDECFLLDNGILYYKHRPVNHFASESAANIQNKIFAGRMAGSKGRGAMSSRRIRINKVEYQSYYLIKILEEYLKSKK